MDFPKYEELTKEKYNHIKQTYAQIYNRNNYYRNIVRTYNFHLIKTIERLISVVNHPWSKKSISFTSPKTQKFIERSLKEIKKQQMEEEEVLP